MAAEDHGGLVRDPRHVVAVLLASSVVIFVTSASLGREILFALTGSVHVIQTNPDLSDRWVDLMSVIVGMLAGYLMGSAPRDPPPPDAG